MRRQRRVAFCLDPGQGPAQAFVTLPMLFDAVGGGRWLAIAFFLLLSGAALRSKWPSRPERLGQ